ncbi:hypothetical protein [Haloarcula amylolytica]|uniref:hypothetical protein n=1 Tax=Haloarcula amylolytica TaxID=396317 RepID=UPI003C7927F2
MFNRTEDYCEECDVARSGNYCNQCGSELTEWDSDELLEHIRDDVVDWPIIATERVPVYIEQDISHILTSACDADRLPFNQSDFHVDLFLDSSEVEITVYKDGSVDFDYPVND